MSDELIYEYVLSEVEEDKTIKKLWAKAIAQSEGNDKKVQSSYMLLRVEAIKKEFSTIGVDYSLLTMDELIHHIEILFFDDDWLEQKILSKKQVETEKEEQEKKAALEKDLKKYRKIRGLLLPFGVILAIWTILATFYSTLFVFTGIDSLTGFLLTDDMQPVKTIKFEFYRLLICMYLLILLSYSFFKKLYGTKTIAITLFIALPVLYAWKVYLEFGLNILEQEENIKVVIALVLACILSILSITYFAISNRVNKTFVQTHVSVPYYKAAILPVILLFSFNQQIPSNWELNLERLGLAEQAFDSKDYEIAIQWFQIASENGASEVGLAVTAYELAEKAFKSEDYETSSKWYQRAYDHNKSHAAFRLAYSYNKIGKYDKAIQYYTTYNKKKPWAPAMESLALVYGSGKKDYSKAVEWGKKAYKSDKKYGAFVVAYSYSELGKDIESANWYEKAIAASPEEPTAYWNLGLAYDENDKLGNIVERKKKAFELFLKAARLGYKQAFATVAFRYRNGIGTMKNLEKAKYWNEKV